MPPAPAVMVALWAAETAPAVTVKAAVLEPAATTTLPGTAAFALLFARLTANPVPVAGPLKITTQAAEPGALILAGEQDNAERETAGVRLMAVLTLWPVSVAVTTAVWLALMVPVITLKVALDAPAGMEALQGILTKGLLLASAMVVAAPADWFRATVQVADCPLPK